MAGICFFAPFDHTEDGRMALAQSEGVFERFGEGERHRIDKISNPSGKALSLGGLCALGRALSATGVSAPLMRISRDKLGKPRFECGAPYFSISHAGKLSVAAVSAEGELGVDIERVDRERDTERIAGKFFSEAEQKRLDAANDRIMEFYRIWTAKEAMMKLSGGGMTSVMSSDCARAEESGERSFARYAISFDGEEYILTLCTVGVEQTEIVACEGVSVSAL